MLRTSVVPSIDFHLEEKEQLLHKTTYNTFVYHRMFICLHQNPFNFHKKRVSEQKNHKKSQKRPHRNKLFVPFKFSINGPATFIYHLDSISSRFRFRKVQFANNRHCMTYFRTQKFIFPFPLSGWDTGKHITNEIQHFCSYFNCYVENL